MFKSSSNVLLTVPRHCLFYESFFYLCFVFVFVILSSLFLADLLALLCVMFLVFLSLSHMVSQVRCVT